MAPAPDRRSPNLSTRQLRAFLALAEQRSFTRAAAACHLSQPAFSALIRTLETELHTRLFDRDTRSVQLTPEGRLFEASARVLRPGGELWSVWNSHLAYRPVLERVVGPTRQVSRTSKFTVTASRKV